MAKLNSIIHGFMQKVKSKSGQRNYLPWLNDKLRSLMKQRDQGLKMALKNKSEHEKRSFITLGNRGDKGVKTSKSNILY